MKKFIINVNGNSYEVEVEEVENGGAEAVATSPTPQPVAQPAAPQPRKAAETPKVPEPTAAVSEGQEIVETPIPGSIFKILVNEGDQVNEGDVLLILEAMKMENEIVSPRDGVVESIAVDTGATVGMGDTLVILK